MNTDQAFQQAAQQGQELQNQFRSQASDYSNQYAQNVSKYNQLNQAAQNAQNEYQTYNRNIVDPTTLYKQALSDAQTSVGFNPGQLGQATQALTRMQGTLNGLVGDQNMGANAQGLGATALAQQYQSNLQPLQSGLATQTAAVGNLSNLYGQTLTQANQQAGLGFQGEQLKSQNYFQAAQQATVIAKQAQDQAAQAMEQMQFYSDLAQKQGGFNSQNAGAYAAAKAAYAQAQASLASAAQYAAQARLAGAEAQQYELANQQTQAVMNIAKRPPTGIQQPSGINMNSIGVPSNKQVQGGRSVQNLMAPKGLSLGVGNFQLQ